MTLYEELGGYDALLAVCRRWNELCLADPVAEHPFSHPTNHPQHDERLAAYLAEATGGPKLYSAGYGTETSMLRMHAGNGGHHEELYNACLRLFDEAVAESGIAESAGASLSRHFREATQALHQHGDEPEDVPPDLPMPSWA